MCIRDSPYSESNDLDIINYTTGSINNYLHAGAAGINTGGFFWLKGKNTSQLMTLTYDGTLGLGVTVPVNTLHVVGTSTVTSNAFIGNNLTVKGNTTIAGNITVDGSYDLVDSDLAGLNLNVTTGHSLVKNLDINNGLKVVGLTTLMENVSIGASLTVGEDYGHTTFENRKFGLNVDRNNNVAIGTDRTFGSSTVNDLDVRHGSAIFAGVGVGKTQATAAVDFANAGRNHNDVVLTTAQQNRMYMYPPKVTTTERGNLVGVTAGAMVYNTSVNRLQVYNGSTWKDCFT